MDYPEGASFEWDPAKARSNLRKHGVSFEEARAVLERGTAVVLDTDESHRGEEDRFVALGILQVGLIHVVFTRPEEGVVRILGARRASPREVALHALRWRGNRT